MILHYCSEREKNQNVCKHLIRTLQLFDFLSLLNGNQFELDEIHCGQKAFTSKVMKAKYPGAPSVTVSVAVGNI